jgi:hypothetical protein
MEKLKSNGQLLTPDFNLNEFTVSQTAERFGYNNTPDNQAILNLKELCVHVLQPFREIIGVPVFISSGYRCPSANAIIGGYYHSQHLEGKAADFLTPSCQLSASFNTILKNLPFDQLIFEFGKWIHVSYNGTENRKQAMISRRVSEKVVYELVYKELA